MNEDNSKLTDSEIAELRAQHVEQDHRRWLWKSIKRLGLWIVAVASGVQSIYVVWRDSSGWLPPK